MSDPQLADRFEKSRAHLCRVAYRMLGSRSEADDAVQEAWLRLSRAGDDGVDNLDGWLTTVVARVCLDMLRSRKSRREDHVEPANDRADASDPERETLLADALGPALLIVLETLDPAERIAFVLHDMFAVPFEDIANIVNRSPAATRQLASRGRRRVQGANPDDTDRSRERDVVAAFLTAARDGNFAALLAVLDPNVALHADSVAQKLGAPRELLGNDAVAKNFCGRAAAARHAIVDGAVGAAWVPDGKAKVAFDFTIVGDKIVAIELLGDLDSVDVELLDA